MWRLPNSSELVSQESLMGQHGATFDIQECITVAICSLVNRGPGTGWNLKTHLWYLCFIVISDRIIFISFGIPRVGRSFRLECQAILRLSFERAWTWIKNFVWSHACLHGRKWALSLKLSICWYIQKCPAIIWHLQIQSQLKVHDI